MWEDKTSVVQLCAKRVIQSVHLDKTAYIQPKITCTAHLTHVQERRKTLLLWSPVTRVIKYFHYVLIYNIITPVKGICTSSQEQVNFMKKKNGGKNIEKLAPSGREFVTPDLFPSSRMLRLLPPEGCRAASIKGQSKFKNHQVLWKYSPAKGKKKRIDSHHLLL